MLNIKKGFTLIEVVVSIALLGILAVAFLPSLTYHFKLLVDTKTNITQNAFADQESMETSIKMVQSALSEGEIDSDDYDDFDITDKFEYIKLFEDDFSSYASRHYPNAYRLEYSGRGNKSFITLVADKRLPPLSVPEIESKSLVFIQDNVESVGTHEYFNYSSLKLRATSNMKSNPQNSFNRYRNDWYVSKPGFNIPVQDITNIDEDKDFGRIYPSFPGDYISLPIHSDLGSAYSYVSMTERVIISELNNNIVNQYPGRHIVYTITPFAKSLKRGNTSSLLPKYVYGPSVTQNLALHLDASTIKMNDLYHNSSNPTGTLFIQDEIYNIMTWKNSRPSLKNPTANLSAVQTAVNNMPVLLRNNDSTDDYTGLALPFQEGQPNERVWSRALGNKGSTMSTMRISSIPNNSMTNNWTLFMVIRKVDAPLVANTGSQILSGNNWSIGWKDISSDLGLSFTRGTESTSPLDLNTEEWFLVQATTRSSPSGIYLKASSLKKDSNNILQSTAIANTNINTRNIDINWNGIELTELLIYNANMNESDLSSIESYLINKYNPDF